MVFQINFEQLFSSVVDQKTTGQAQVFAVEHAYHIRNRNTQLLHTCGIQVDADGTALLTAQLNFTHTIDGFQPFLDDVAGILVELLQGPVTGQNQPHDG